MKTGDYKRIFTKTDEHTHEHGDTSKARLHENRQSHGIDHIHDHKLSLNREQVMDMHDRERNKTRS